MQKAGAIGLFLSAIISFMLFRSFNHRLEHKREEDAKKAKELIEKEPLDQVQLDKEIEKEFVEVMQKEFKKERDDKIKETIRRRLANAKNFESDED